ncbi:MAG: signal recognition particle-docking protein FtsY [Armatimonadota bacterium]|nr:signal recognition particle-docking protein FtsY [Armatimonadota bacterium]
MAADVVAQLRRRAMMGVWRPEDLRRSFREIIVDHLGAAEPLRLDPPPAVVLVLGVNGSGKTTTIGKLAHRLTHERRRVLIAAADTFRAAAIEQVQVWADRAGVPVVRHREGADPAAVVYDALQALGARRADVLIVDTAGRLHTKVNLMEELRKIRRVVERHLPAAPVESLLVLDANTGQNGLQQARQFQQAVPLTGIVVAKLDSSAKGGVLLAIGRSMRISVKFVGTGEGVDDLHPFDPEAFADALFPALGPAA